MLIERLVAERAQPEGYIPRRLCRSSLKCERPAAAGARIGSGGCGSEIGCKLCEDDSLRKWMIEAMLIRIIGSGAAAGE